MKNRRRRKKRSPRRITMIILILAVLIIILGLTTVLALSGNQTGLLDKIGKKTSINPLTGLECTEELPARPVIVSIDNVGDAIPQSWISKADMVYEFPVEGEQTRIQAIYYSQFPDAFGPIRSARPYFIDLAREYNAVFIAHGWSPDAKSYLQSGVVPYINASDPDNDCHFYRVDDKELPHNSYTEWADVQNKIEEEGWWDETQEIDSFGFLSDGQSNEGESITYISFSYDNSDYAFTYDDESGKYTKTISGNEYVDHETGEPITTDNVLVQKVTSSVLDSKGRLSIDMCEGGEAILFTGGVMVDGTWSRSSLDSRTVFTDNEGSQMLLTPGITWVEVTDQNCNMTYQ